MERHIMDRKYKITYSGKITGKTPNYILSPVSYTHLTLPTILRV